MKQNPFSLYDFLGYLIPGVAFLIGVVLLRRIGQDPETWTALLAPINVLGKVELFVPLVIVAYVLGHFLSYLSSITVEKYSIWTLGYPSQYLLALPVVPFLAPPKSVKPRRAVRILVAGLLAPLSLLEVVCYWLGFRKLYAKPLDQFLVRFIVEQVNLFGKQQYAHIPAPKTSLGEDQDFFRIVYHYTVEHAPAHAPKMQNYVALYGFARTLTLEAVTFFWLSVFFFLVGRYPAQVFVGLAASSAFASLLLYLDFNKFYRKFSLESFMALLATWTPSNGRGAKT